VAIDRLLSGSFRARLDRSPALHGDAADRGRRARAARRLLVSPPWWGVVGC